jgi:hypothetical protein
MASAALPSAADPKMADLCNHTTQAYSSDGCAENGYFKRPIQPNIDGDIWSVSGWVFVGFWVGRPPTRDTLTMAAAVVPWPPWRPGPDAEA